ncbi:bifunctional GNAT family N-acetyltransferase/acetate--CoA ligase family protein [Amycolatopsis sp. ATCC 39116]|uniref:bifunctional acetate--CoA ligase family protein/GNAT family N-acetyltransferase n=1 Tax=Amycolatopsis sp. (strain ATCC 39116 / 75iv2) TaxID=385957 RepID=UPI0004851DC4|nr:bifunctional GNAT family N-acetyltransferase/acetate--CoA ligase family protein [Amycolatopsis sp. ATCC 39116]
MTAGQDVAAVLADGEVVEIRPLRPADAPAALALHEGLDERDSYFRFFGLPGRLDELVARMCAEPGPRRAAVGAFRHGELLGVAHYEVSAEPTEAELALAVGSAAKAHGVGTLLLEHLVALARGQGIRRFTGQVLAENSRMLRVFADLGLPYRVSAAGSECDFSIGLDEDEAFRSRLAERERIADVASLRHVLQPRSVAVIGAGRDPASVGHAVLVNLAEGGYSGRLSAVNPHARDIAGVPCASSVADLPETPELAVVCVPASAVPGVVEECGRRGTRAAVIISAGLTGTGLGARTVRAARTHGVRLVGPNCVGVANTEDGIRLNATFAPGRMPSGRVGVVTQSGGFGIAVVEALRRLGLGVSTMVSTGDKYDVSGNDLLRWWREDPRTDLAVLYLESFGNPRKFARIARDLARVKPVLAVRTGQTETARRAAASHTAATATPAVTRDALHEQAGVIAVDSVTELLEAVAALSWQPLPAGRRVAVLSNAGGAGVLAADACARHGLKLPDLSPGTVSRLRELLPAQASVRNPVDTTAAVTAEVFGACLDAVLADDGIDAVVVAGVATAVGDPLTGVATRHAGDKPVLVVRPGQLPFVEPLLTADGLVPSYADALGAAGALGSLARYAAWRAEPDEAPPRLSDVDTAAARRIVAGATGWLDPLDATRLLRCFGIPVVATRFATDADEAVDALRELGGPVAVKACATGLVHKSSGGGVALDVRGENQLREIVHRWRDRFGDQWRGVVVQPMVAHAREVLAGIAGDDVFGPLVVFGLGGVDTDLVADRAARLAPLTSRDADLLLSGLRSSPHLFGPGGFDRAALRDVLVRLSRLAEVLPEVAELDLNPVVAHDGGCLVLDARVRLAPHTPAEPFLRRLRI